jgi:hypothetical protein
VRTRREDKRGSERATRGDRRSVAASEAVGAAASTQRPAAVAAAHVWSNAKLGAGLTCHAVQFEAGLA